MITTDPVAEVLSRLKNVKRCGEGWSTRCPAHDDHRNSLSIGRGDKGQVLINCHAGCVTEAIVAKIGLTMAGLFPSEEASTSPNGRARPVATYDYVDEDGTLLFQSVRYAPKDFSQRRPDGRGDWIWNLKGVRRVLYRLPDLLAAEPSALVLVVEGEKDVDRLRALGFVATTNPMGAGKWRGDDARCLQDRRVVLIPDNDPSGEQHVAMVGKTLDGVAAEVRLLRLPHLPPHGDVSDWLDAGNTTEDLRRLIEAAPAWEPSPEDEGEDDDASSARVGRSRSQATVLIDLAQEDDNELFHDPAGTAYITFSQDGHQETWRLDSPRVRLWLRSRYFARNGTTPNSQALRDALETLEGIAQFKGRCQAVFVRLAGHDGAIDLDLGNDAWEVVRITAKGWSIIPAAEAPVRFRRPPGMLPLPHPVRGGSFQPLRELLNVRDDRDFALLVAWLLGALRPTGPYPMLGLSGEQGTAKTTGARMVRALIDPNQVPLRAEPRSEEDLLIAAVNGRIVAFDNLSFVKPWLSDALCRLSTGGGLSKRQLYTDAEEVLLDATRPVLFTGINPVLTRSDAVDRAIQIELVPIAEDERRTEAEVWAEFEAVRPGVLGALLDAASTALRRGPTTILTHLPRMADFAHWVESAAPAFGWEPEYFCAVYGGNREGADVLALESSPVGSAVLAYMDVREAWTGTAADLLALLPEHAPERERDRPWPKRPNLLSGELKRMAPHLRRMGLEVKTGIREPGGRRRLIHLTWNAPSPGTTGEARDGLLHSPNDAVDGDPAYPPEDGEWADWQRHLRHDRHKAHDDAALGQARPSQASSQIGAAASQAVDQDPWLDAETEESSDGGDDRDADLLAPMDDLEADRYAIDDDERRGSREAGMR